MADEAIKSMPDPKTIKSRNVPGQPRQPVTDHPPASLFHHRPRVRATRPLLPSNPARRGSCANRVTPWPWLFRRLSHSPGAPALAFLALSALSMDACTSVQWLDAAGRPRNFGLASIASAATDETVTRIVAPGASLRLIPGLVGYSIGWRETVLFQSSDPETNGGVVAFADRIYGITVDASQIVVGAAHGFAVLEPPASTNVIQEIHYAEADPASSRIRRQEVK